MMFRHLKSRIIRISILKVRDNDDIDIGKDSLPGANVWGSHLTSHSAPAHLLSPPDVQTLPLTESHILSNNQDYPGLSKFI